MKVHLYMYLYHEWKLDSVSTFHVFILYNALYIYYTGLSISWFVIKRTEIYIIKALKCTVLVSDMVDIYHNFKLVVRNLIALHMLYRNPEAMPLSLVLTRKQYTVIQVLTGSNTCTLPIVIKDRHSSVCPL